MVLTTGDGVNGYTLDNALGEFILTHPNVCLGSSVLMSVETHGGCFCFGSGRSRSRREARFTPVSGNARKAKRGCRANVRGVVVNEGNSMYFHEPVIKYLESIKYPKNGKPYSARYIGSMVADVHRTLLYGGIFGYPGDKKSKNGKLRMLYEAFPMAMLTEQVSEAPLRGLRELMGLGT